MLIDLLYLQNRVDLLYMYTIHALQIRISFVLAISGPSNTEVKLAVQIFESVVAGHIDSVD